MNVIVTIQNINFPVDFIVMAGRKGNGSSPAAPMLLGITFLMTANAVINSEKGIVKIANRDLLAEQNLFTIGKIPSFDEDDLYEVEEF